MKPAVATIEPGPGGYRAFAQEVARVWDEELDLRGFALLAHPRLRIAPISRYSPAEWDGEVLLEFMMQAPDAEVDRDGDLEMISVRMQTRLSSLIPPEHVQRVLKSTLQNWWMHEFKEGFRFQGDAPPHPELKDRKPDLVAELSR